MAWEQCRCQVISKWLDEPHRMTKKNSSHSGDEVPRNDFSIIRHHHSPSNLTKAPKKALKIRSSAAAATTTTTAWSVGGKTTKCAENCEKWMITYACNKVKSWRRHSVVNGWKCLANPKWHFRCCCCWCSFCCPRNPSKQWVKWIYKLLPFRNRNALRINNFGANENRGKK